MKSSAPTPPSTSLCSLPPELHDKIWSLTFESRTISIYFHEGRTPDNPTHPSATLPPTKHCQLKPACIAFTAALGVESPALVEDRINRLNPRTRSPFGYFTVPYEMRRKPPPGPIALQVCRQSRHFAKKHYELAFAGVNFIHGDDEFEKLWRRQNLSEKRIWVNFKLDVLFFHNADARSSIWGTRNEHIYDLEILAELAQSEVSKVKNLAISGVWSDISNPHRSWGNHPNPEVLPPCPVGPLRLVLERTFHRFKNLQNLLVHNADLNRHGMRPFAENQDVILADLKHIEEAIHKYLKSEKNRSVGVTVLKGFALASQYQRGRLRFQPLDQNAPTYTPPNAPSTMYFFPIDAHHFATLQIPVPINVAGNHALQDYQMQLNLLEQQNKKRRAIAEREEMEWIAWEIEVWKDQAR